MPRVRSTSLCFVINTYSTARWFPNVRGYACRRPPPRPPYPHPVPTLSPPLYPPLWHPVLIGTTLRAGEASSIASHYTWRSDVYNALLVNVEGEYTASKHASLLQVHVGRAVLTSWLSACAGQLSAPRWVVGVVRGGVGDQVLSSSGSLRVCAARSVPAYKPHLQPSPRPPSPFPTPDGSGYPVHFWEREAYFQFPLP
jgi:hypothetical protein